MKEQPGALPCGFMKILTQLVRWVLLALNISTIMSVMDHAAQPDELHTGPHQRVAMGSALCVHQSSDKRVLCSYLGEWVVVHHEVPHQVPSAGSYI